MDLVKYAAFLVALLTSIGLLLFAYFEGLRISDKEGKVRGEGFIVSLSLGIFFAMMATRLQ
ncbi:hypothetical protein FZC76_16850 [Sutcliffiella horikoshii]|jgi:hypothetical protein|uniref:Uncharacterized protein n=1 Tax=Sutcliffiella horikoshii TaxID=79883 RepID=A0A5D4SUU8_9BACI|nr:MULTISPECIES: hypothetical protein [Bacillaceae]MEA3320208.1 hypothetical protein [Bacillota bacterium]NMH71817.1 hypothetical protein [Bacillus sp. RO2]TYS67187.1 hypothetical protein FZC76_16850 [Sutcliffiella horikoshii]